MTRHSIRYIFEHKLLPELFFENKEYFIGWILDERKNLYNMLDELFVKENVQNPYTKKDFSIEATKVKGEVLMLKLVFPEPEEEPLCYSAYMFFDKQFEKISYFCIEKGNEAGDNLPFVCEWSPEGVHYNYGTCSWDKYADFLRCAKIYLEKNYGESERVIDG